MFIGTIHELYEKVGLRNEEEVLIKLSNAPVRFPRLVSCNDIQFLTIAPSFVPTKEYVILTTCPRHNHIVIYKSMLDFAKHAIFTLEI